MSEPLSIDLALSDEENIVALIHHTYPTSIGMIDAENYTFQCFAINHGNPEANNTLLSIAAKITANLSGRIDVEYNRFVAVWPDEVMVLPEGFDIDAVDSNSELYLVTHYGVRTQVEVTGARPGIEYTFTLPEDNLLFTWSNDLKVFIPEIGSTPPEMDTIITGTPLNGFGGVIDPEAG